MTHEQCKAAILAREAVRDAAYPSTEHELRQQLADVSNERDEANKRHSEVLLCFGMMRDERDDLQIKLNASEARNSEAERLLSDVGLLLGLLYPEQADMDKWRDGVSTWLAQSAPATEDHRAKCGRTLHYFLGGACKYCNEPAPATDEQGAGS